MNILKEWQRMCRAMSDEKEVCSYDCPIAGNCLITCESIESITEIDIEDMEQKIRKWAEEHPRKTYLQDFKEKFPKANEDRIPGWCCVEVIYKENRECVPDRNCVDCWNRPMED